MIVNSINNAHLSFPFENEIPAKVMERNLQILDYSAKIKYFGASPFALRKRSI
jgi:hypothetical protein